MKKILLLGSGELGKEFVIAQSVQDSMSWHATDMRMPRQCRLPMSTKCSTCSTVTL